MLDSIEGTSVSPSKAGSMYVVLPESKTKDANDTRMTTENSIMGQRFSQIQGFETTSQYMNDFIDIQTAILNTPDLQQQSLQSPMVFRARLKSRAGKRTSIEPPIQSGKTEQIMRVARASPTQSRAQVRRQQTPQLQAEKNRTCARRNSNLGKRFLFMHVEDSNQLESQKTELLDHQQQPNGEAPSAGDISQDQQYKTRSIPQTAIKNQNLLDYLRNANNSSEQTAQVPRTLHQKKTRQSKSTLGQSVMNKTHNNDDLISHGGLIDTDISLSHKKQDKLSKTAHTPPLTEPATAMNDKSLPVKPRQVNIQVQKSFMKKNEQTSQTHYSRKQAKSIVSVYKDKGKSTSPISILKNLKQSSGQRVSNNQSGLKSMTPIERILTQTQKLLQKRSSPSKNEKKVASLSHQNNVFILNKLCNDQSMSFSGVPGYQEQSMSRTQPQSVFTSRKQMGSALDTESAKRLNSVSFKRDMKPAEMEQFGIYPVGYTVPKPQPILMQSIPVPCDKECTCGSPKQGGKHVQYHLVENKAAQQLAKYQALNKVGKRAFTPNQTTRNAAQKRGISLKGWNAPLISKPISIATATNLSQVLANNASPERARPQTQSAYYRSSNRKGRLDQLAGQSNELGTELGASGFNLVDLIKQAGEQYEGESPLLFELGFQSVPSHARAKLDKMFKVKVLRTTTMPKVQALSSNQTLTQEGVSNKDHQDTRKTTDRSNFGHVNANYSQSPYKMNADLTVVQNDVPTQIYKGNQHKRQAAEPLSSGKEESTLDLIDLQTQGVSSTGKQEPPIKKHQQPRVTSSPKPNIVTSPKAANQFQESYSNHNWMSPRIIEHQSQVIVTSVVPKVVNSNSNSVTEPELDMDSNGQGHCNSGSVKVSSMEGLHGKKINLVEYDKDAEQISRAQGIQVNEYGSSYSKASIMETKSYSLQVPPMKIEPNHENTLHKNDSLNSKGLFQVTEKNSENASMVAPSQLQHNMITANLRSTSYKSMQNISNNPSEQRSSILFAELSRLEKELKERGATPIMTRETTQDKVKRSKILANHKQHGQYDVVNDGAADLQVVGWRQTKPSTYEYPQ